jgi:hypothetical protein
MLSLLLHELSLHPVVLGLVWSTMLVAVGAVQVGRVSSGRGLLKACPRGMVISFVSARAVKRRYHHPFRRGDVEPLNSAQCLLGTVL